MKTHYTEMDLPKLYGMTVKEYLESVELEKIATEEGSDEYYEALQYEITGKPRKIE